jgi:hypothetical protein
MKYVRLAAYYTLLPFRIRKPELQHNAAPATRLLSNLRGLNAFLAIRLPSWRATLKL